METVKKNYFFLFVGICIILSIYLCSWHTGHINYQISNENKAFTSLSKSNTSTHPLITVKHGEENLLNHLYVANTVHYVWCGKRWFEFQHYLSMKSVLMEVNPDLIIFHYEVLPVVDKWIYNTWFDELRKEFPFINVKAADKTKQICLESQKPNPEFIIRMLLKHGGIYVHEQTMLLWFPGKFREYDFINGTDDRTGHGFILAKKGYLQRKSSVEILGEFTFKTHNVQCITDKLMETKSSPLCINIASTIYPKDIWLRNDEFGRATRKVFYGSQEIRVAKPNYDSLIPNIAHMIWLGGGQMDFLFYLSVLSLLHVVEVDNLYIHGDAPPSGPYWERVKYNPRLHHIFREIPSTVFGKSVKDLKHVSDIWRVDFMIRYGGIYVDTDAVFVKPLDPFIRAFDAVASYDWTDWNQPFPNRINFGVMAGKKNASYWHHFQKSMDMFRDQDFSWNGLRQPYKVLEKYPNLIRIDPHFQVICYNLKCHPTWHPQFHKDNIHHLNSDSIKYWKHDTYAFHWTAPTPPELIDETSLYHSKSMFAKIGRFILEEAGVDIRKYLNANLLFDSQ